MVGQDRKTVAAADGDDAWNPGKHVRGKQEPKRASDRKTLYPAGIEYSSPVT